MSAMVGRSPSMNGAAGEPLVDDGEIAVDAALEERHHRRIAGGLGEVLQEAVRPEKAVDLLVVEDDPAQRFEPLVLALGLEFAGALGEIGQDHAGLGELLCRRAPAPALRPSR